MVAFWGAGEVTDLLIESVYKVTAPVVGGMIMGYFVGVLSSVLYRSLSIGPLRLFDVFARFKRRRRGERLRPLPCRRLRREANSTRIFCLREEIADSAKREMGYR